MKIKNLSAFWIKSKENIRIYGIPEDFSSEEDDGERKLLEIAAKLDIPIDATHDLQ